MKRKLYFLYGVVNHLLFLGVFVYLLGFLANVLVAKSIDSGPTGPVAAAVTVNLLLMGLFAAQHSIMARPAFKKVWTRIIPQPIERSTYVLLSNVVTVLLMWLWRPLPGIVWDFQQPVLRWTMWGLFLVGSLLVPAVTLLINHFDLFGLRQVWLPLIGRPYTRVPFRTPLPYRYVRHPLYLGFLLAFWMTPTMTLAHLVFAVATTAYIVLAIQFEERDLVVEHGHAYEEYRRTVPMLLPRPASRVPMARDVSGETRGEAV